MSQTMTTIHVEEIAFTGYPVTDIKRARQFYEGIFNLKPSETNDESVWVEYEIGSGAFAIVSIDAWKPVNGGPMIGLEVKNYDETLETLRSKSIAILAEHDTPVCRMAQIMDPDGNLVMVHKRK